MHTQQVIKDSEVTDHHALIPTSTMPGQDGAVRALTTGERDLLFLVCTRLLCALDDACIEEETVLHIECAGHDFTAKGRRMVQMGFKRFWVGLPGKPWKPARGGTQGASTHPARRHGRRV